MKQLYLLMVFLVMAIPTLAQDAEKTAEPITIRTCLRQIESYVVYYGEGRAEDLARYDLAIIQPETLTESEITNLHEQGTLLVAYLSVGEVEPYRTWMEDGRMEQDWILGENTIWGSFYIDANQRGWQDLMIELMGESLEHGYDGVFLDTVDTVDAFPDTIPGMIALIEGLREAYPDALLVQNRGFTIVEDTAPFVDAVMFEDVSTTYDFDAERYERVDNMEDAALMTDVKEQTGLPILALDYVAEGDTETAQDVIAIAQEYGFIPSISTIALDDIPDYGFDPERQIPPCIP
jgi:uncharacterized protein (TIGR01370 family)